MTREFVKHAILTVDIFVTSGDKSTNMLLFVLFCFCFCVFFLYLQKRKLYNTERILGYSEPKKVSGVYHYIMLIISSKWRTKYRSSGGFAYLVLIFFLLVPSPVVKYELVIWIVEVTEISATTYDSFAATKTKAD